jgi:hypothetical protein
MYWSRFAAYGLAGELLDDCPKYEIVANSDAANPDTIATEIMGAVCTSAQFSSNC